MGRSARDRGQHGKCQVGLNFDPMRDGMECPKLTKACKPMASANQLAAHSPCPRGWPALAIPSLPTAALVVAHMVAGCATVGGGVSVPHQAMLAQRTLAWGVLCPCQPWVAAPAPAC